MPDPDKIIVPKDAWLELAGDVFTGFVRRFSTNPTVYYQTYRVAGELPPVIVDPSHVDFEGIPVFEGNKRVFEITSTEAIDVYILCLGDAGLVRVDV